MAGLGRRLLGAALVGTGQGILHNAKTKREDTLLALRRQWQVEDRDAAAGLTREGYDRADTRAEMTAERADARAEASRPLVPVTGDDGVTRYVERGDAIGGRVPAKPRDKGSEPLEEIIGPDGKPVLVPRSQAAGKTPYHKPGKDGRLYEEIDPETGLPTGRWLTREQAIDKGADMDTAARSAEVDAAISDAESWWPEWLGGKRDPTDEEQARAYEIARNNPEMTGREALMRAMGIGGRGDEPGQGGAGKPAGDGSAGSPYEVTSQAHVDWLKANAKPGSVYRHNGQTFRVK